jgi:hypothetical protein
MLASLEVIRAHLAGHQVAAPVSVDLDVLVGRVTVQLGETGLSAVAGGLLSWANTLTGVTGEAWRVPNGETVHLSVTGHTVARVAVRVYDAVEYDPIVFPGLVSGGRHAVTPAGLRAWCGGAAA